MKKYITAGLIGLSFLTGCQKTALVENPRIIQQKENKISYRLEDLCDTEIYEKGITLNVYIENSNILWDYHKYKDEIFQYVKDFFRENQINCYIVYSNSPFQKFNSNNKFGLEIWDSQKDLENRYFQLVTETNKIPKDNPLKFAGKGYAVTRTGVALVNGGWEEFRDQMKIGELSIEEIEKQFPEKYKGMSVKEYQFKNNMAANICHELGHCMGLFHCKTFDPVLVDLYYKDVPNIMSYCNMKVKEGYSIGYSLNPLQKKLLHSFVAGNNNYKAFISSQRDLEFYKAFISSQRDLEFYLDNIKDKNNLKYYNP